MNQPYPPPPPSNPPFFPQVSGKGCLKFALIGCGVLVILAILGVFAIGAWWKRSGSDLMERAEAVEEEGRKAGLSTDEAGCMRLAQARRGGGMGALVGTSIYLDSCLETSRATPGFCEGVPRPTEPLRSMRWETAQCRNPNDLRCRTLVQAKQEYCFERRWMKTSAAAADSMGAEDDTAGIEIDTVRAVADSGGAGGEF